MRINALINTLLARLPELEWQLAKLGTAFEPETLPRGLFRQPIDAPVFAYIDEIKAEIAVLADHGNRQAASFLAARINQKINVLVTICARYNQHNPAQHSPPGFILEQLATRKQQFELLEQAIKTLSSQRDAMLRRLQEPGSEKSTELHLNLQRELGDIEKRLTLAKEAYDKAK
ncbi:hypothetical protein ACFORL_07355 [Legionella dresdenensis]|uniref:Coiled-coil protein n=1 Tax=Legionella dresdenensis TaxID=450200 RepID=A0ABV8CFM6_9GAMM